MVKDGLCAVQVINVTDVELTIEAMVPLGLGYPVKRDAYTECAAVFMFELEHLVSHQVVGEVGLIANHLCHLMLLEDPPQILTCPKQISQQNRLANCKNCLRNLGMCLAKIEEIIVRTQLLMHLFSLFILSCNLQGFVIV